MESGGDQSTSNHRVVDEWLFSPRLLTISLSLSLSLIHRTEHDVYPSPFAPRVFKGGPTSHLLKKSPTL